jgi:hypothetical protein
MADARFRPPWIIMTGFAIAVRWMQWKETHDGPDEEGSHAEAASEETPLLGSATAVGG